MLRCEQIAVLGDKTMKPFELTRRKALRTIGKSAAALLTVSVSARSLGLSAALQVPEKIVLGTIPINPTIASYIGQVDFFKEEGLTVETTRFNNFAPILQAMAAGGVLAGDFGVVSSIIGLTRGLPLIAPFLGAYSTPSHPLERIMVMENSPIRDLDDLKGKKLAFLGPGTVPDMFLGALPKRTKIRKEDIELVPMCRRRTCPMRLPKGWSMRSLPSRQPIRLRSRDTRLARSPTRPISCPMRDWARLRSSANSPRATRRPPRSFSERAYALPAGSTTT